METPTPTPNPDSLYSFTFEEIDKTRTTELANYMINLIKSEIYLKLPFLEDKEKRQRENFILNNDNIDKDSFYESLKKKYSNFIELTYIPNDLLHELYENVINYENNKYSFKNRYFSYSTFIKKMIELTVADEFDKYLDEKFVSINSNALDNYDNFWLNALFDSKYANTPSPTINDIIKFNSDLNSTSIIITIELFYKNIENDLYTLLINRPETKRIIVKFEQRSYWINNNFQPMVYTEDEEWNYDMNRILNIILNCAFKMRQLQCLSILADQNCNFLLDEKSCESIIKIFKKHKDIIEIATFCRIQIPKQYQDTIIQSIFKAKNSKIILFKSAKFTDDILEKIKTFYKENSIQFKDKVVYIRYSKKCLITF